MSIQTKVQRATNDILNFGYFENTANCEYVLSEAFAISRFVTHMTHSIEGCTSCTDYCYVKQRGEMKKFSKYMCTVVTLGKSIYKIESIQMRVNAV